MKPNDVSKMQIWSYLFLVKIFRGSSTPPWSKDKFIFPVSHKLLPKWPWFTCGDFSLLSVSLFSTMALLNFVSVPFTLFSLEFLCPFFQNSPKPLHPNFFLLIFNGLLRHHFLCCVCMNNQISHAWTDSWILLIVLPAKCCNHFIDVPELPLSFWRQSSEDIVYQ